MAESTAHPAKMLPAVAAYAIAHYTRPGELVLDPMCGIDTTLVEAVRLGRRAVGIEYEPHWVEVSRTAEVTTSAACPTHSGGRSAASGGRRRGRPITIRPWREHAELIDLPSQILSCGVHAGLIPVERCVALLARAGDGDLVPRGSFFQRDFIRKQRDAGLPLHLISHEDVLVFRTLRSRQSSRELRRSQRELGPRPRSLCHVDTRVAAEVGGVAS